MKRYSKDTQEENGQDKNGPNKTEDQSLSKDHLVCDFTGGAVGHRLKFGGGRGQALPKAAGFTKGRTPTVIDATAGFGRDAFLLASLGAEVTLIERSVDVHGMLREGLERASCAGGQVADIVSRMTLLFGDAKELLPELSADVIVVDPMHPPRKTKALVKKEMRVLRQFVGADPDAEDLVKVALEVAKKRVVLKWPAKGDPLPNIKKPSHQLMGKSTRYDVFMLG